MSEQLAVFIDFENIALWAEREFIDFEVTTLMEYLQTRGPAVVKRAYGDWSRFSRYRDAMMNNSIDLIQIYSVRSGKNRADIRMAIDAFEISMTRPHINTYVVVSGDSDFSPLVAKLREYGRYTLGIGPRNITHDLLVKSCDEFVYLETALGEMADLDEQSCIELELARTLLGKAIQAHGQRGDVPILATRLKQTMLLMDPAFNEANFGYAQFKTWLEENPDIVKLFIKDLQLFVAPVDYMQSEKLDFEKENGSKLAIELPVKDILEPTQRPLDSQYRQVISRLKMSSVELSTRRDILRDIYRELQECPGEYTTEELLELLWERYEAQGLMRNKTTIREVLQLAFRQKAFDYGDRAVSPYVPVWVAPGLESEAGFIERAEADFVYAIVRAGLDIDNEELAYLFLNDRGQTDYIQGLLNDLETRNLIVSKDDGYNLPGRGMIPFADEPALRVLLRDIDEVQLPDHLQSGSDAARVLAKKAMVQRSQDFAASSDTYLYACRVQWDAVQADEPGATLEDLRWYMASYASAVAGKLSQVNRDYGSARPYYLAFFSLVQEDDPLWSRMRGLINPMLAYYWANAGRELNVNVTAWNLSMSSPAQIAVYAATHPDVDLQRMWQNITLELARINPGLLNRIANQLRMNRSEEPEHARVAEYIESILANVSLA